MFFLLQEHWLTPANLYKFDKHFIGYFSFGCSAMTTAVESGMLRGRPFGGVICLIKSSLRGVTSTVHCSERYVIVKVGDCIIINIYLPCVGSINRELLCDDLFAEINAWCQHYSDFNTDLDSADSVARLICTFAKRYSMLRCDEFFLRYYCPTYVNMALNQQSRIDYILATSGCHLSDFSVVDPHINFSDHLPLMVVAKCSTPSQKINLDTTPQRSVTQLRWDKADLGAFYHCTGLQLNPLLFMLDDALSYYNNGVSNHSDTAALIDTVYCEVVDTLVSCANNFVPVRIGNRSISFGGMKSCRF